jgi:hypothetical protein
MTDEQGTIGGREEKVLLEFVSLLTRKYMAFYKYVTKWKVKLYSMFSHTSEQTGVNSYSVRNALQG